MKKSLAVVVRLLVGAALVGTAPAWALTPEQEAKLLASDAAGGDHFGRVALDGNTALIGASLDDDNGTYSGSAYVFTRTGTVWVEQAKLLPADGDPGDWFGYAVAIDGDTAVIGAPCYHESDSGWAYVFTRTGDVWTEQAKLLPADGAEADRFGMSVAVDGDTAVIGANVDDDNGDGSGSAYVFTRTGGVWSQQAKLLPVDGEENAVFGTSVAVAGDMALIGSPSFYGIGSSYVFTRVGDVWTEQAKLFAEGDPCTDQGRSVALADDTAVIGDPCWRDDDVGPASVFVFVREGDVWTQQATLRPPYADGFAEDEYGVWVALDDDTVVAGASAREVNGSASGAAYVFTRKGGVWTVQAELHAADGAEDDSFGGSVALDGDTALIGAKGDDDNGSYTGSAYVFRLCDHRMTITTDAGDTLIFLKPDPGVFDVVTGSLSSLLADNDFSHAECLVPSTGNPAVDPSPDPIVGDGRYYLGRPLSYCGDEGYGDSSLTPDPRDALDAAPCP